MSKLEEIVPPPELSRQIPAGNSKLRPFNGIRNGSSFCSKGADYPYPFRFGCAEMPDIHGDFRTVKRAVGIEYGEEEDECYGQGIFHFHFPFDFCTEVAQCPKVYEASNEMPLFSHPAPALRRSALSCDCQRKSILRRKPTRQGN
ncbi:MAG: hypothetical protein HPZ91_19205 [Lentisphaeria bacterium]|nr:hypothetical protein [Lentisphaeria bacterium]